MSGEGIALAALCVTLLGILVSVVRKNAVTETSHLMRIQTLERAVSRLDKWTGAGNSRVSQGRFDEGDTDRPPRE